jgi:hypothetical protein
MKFNTADPHINEVYSTQSDIYIYIYDIYTEHVAGLLTVFVRSFLVLISKRCELPKELIKSICFLIERFRRPIGPVGPVVPMEPVQNRPTYAYLHKNRYHISMHLPTSLSVERVRTPLQPIKQSRK